MDIAFTVTALGFVVLNSIFFYYKGYMRAKKDNKVVDKFAGKISYIIDDSVARGVLAAIENFENHGMIETEVSESGIDTPDGPQVVKRYYTSVDDEFSLAFDFLYNPKSNSYKLLDEETE